MNCWKFYQKPKNPNESNRIFANVLMGSVVFSSIPIKRLKPWSRMATRKNGKSSVSVKPSFQLEARYINTYTVVQYIQVMMDIWRAGHGRTLDVWSGRRHERRFDSLHGNGHERMDQSAGHGISSTISRPNHLLRVCDQLDEIHHRHYHGRKQMERTNQLSSLTFMTKIDWYRYWAFKDLESSTVLLVTHLTSMLKQRPISTVRITLNNLIMFHLHR